MDSKLGGSPASIAVAKTLTDLPAQLPHLKEREFLMEALSCYRVQAYRAAVVMTWNLAYDHLVGWVLSPPPRLSAMNLGISSKFPNKSLTMESQGDADELKESEFIEAARTAKLLDKNMAQILREKLSRRNMAAHPSRAGDQPALSGRHDN